MTEDNDRRRTRRRAPRRTTLLLTVFAMSLIMAVGGLGHAGAAVTADPPSLHTHARTITLITGDQITLTPVTVATGSRYTVTMRPAARLDGTVPATSITARTTSAGTDQIAARPLDAVPYLAGGSIDRGLFDVSYLAGRQGGQLPVVVQYTAPLTDSELASRADGLPASTLAQTMGSVNAAKVNVDLRHAGEFWAAITGTRSSEQPATRSGTPAGGIAAVWLDGHRLGTSTAVTPATEPLYTLTQTVKAHAGGVCSEASNVCPLAAAALRLDGADAGQTYFPSDYSCVEATAPCDTLQLHFRVPAGLYSLNGIEFSTFNDGTQYFEVDNPELRIGNDTTVHFDLDTASNVTVTTPRPNDAYNGVMESARTLPDGTEFTNLTFNAYHNSNYWATPTDPVATGTFYFKTTWALGQPLVTMSVKAPSRLDLHPIYPSTLSTAIERFSGKQTLTLIDGGTGSAADFAKIDARGKLVLVRNEPTGAAGCLVARATLQTALRSGAAGLLIDPTQPLSRSGSCDLPMPPYWEFWELFGADHVRMPFAELKLREARQLHGLLDSGPVRIQVTDNGEPSYTYDISSIVHGRIPTSLAAVYSGKQLAEIDAAYHASQPARAVEQTSSFALDEALTGGTSVVFSSPTGRKVYIGPVSPELVHYRSFNLSSRVEDTPLAQAQKLAVYDQAGPAGTEDWGDQPSPPGVPEAPTKVFQAQPGRFQPVAACSICRQDNDFTPWAYLSSRDPSQQVFERTGSLAGIDPSTVHLFHDGQELTQTTNSMGFSEYTLPAASTRYRLTMDEGNTDTAWDFTSAKPVEDRTPNGYTCGSVILGNTGSCQPAPVIFLRYGPDDGADNTITAPGIHQVHIDAYHQGEDAPAVSTLTAWTSVDGGTTWTAARTARHGSGEFVATYSVPRVTTEHTAVSLKVQARDAAGNDVTQIITDALRLTAAQR